MLSFTLTLLLFLSAFFCGIYIYYAYKCKWLDIPNQRSSHTRVTPRGGGLVFISLWSLAVMSVEFLGLIDRQFLLILLPGTLIVAVIGFIDDCYTLTAKFRALGYFIAAIISVHFLGGFTQIFITHDLVLPLSWGGSLIAVLAILWSTNLFNFMDGIDGVTAVEALFVLVMGASFLSAAGATQPALLALMLAACVGGFLIWNKPPAKLFMGDVGSASLGFIVMVFAMMSEQLYQVPFLLWMILYALFLVDTTLTLFRRIWAGQKWYQAHRLHAYQRLHQAGWSHKKVMIAVISVNSVLAVFALIGFIYQNLIIFLLVLSFMLVFVLYLKIERLYPMFAVKK